MSPPAPTPTRTMAGVRRYPPWLQKAMRIRAEAEGFWVQAASSPAFPVRPSTTASASPTVQPRSSTVPAFATIWAAIEADRAEDVDAWLAEDPTRRLWDRRDGATLLHEAAAHGALEVTRWILSQLEVHYPSETRRAAVNAVDTVHARTTPLIAACRSVTGFAKTRMTLAGLLVAAGADVDRQDAHGDNALHWCARTANLVLVRFLLRATDAEARAVFAENYKRDKPLDIAKRVLAQRNTYETRAVFEALRGVDRKCNLRLKMQAIRRQHVAIEAEAAAEVELEWAVARETSMALADRADRLWGEAMKRADENRKEAEETHANAAVQAAQLAAWEWLESKDGKAFVKRNTPMATEELKADIQRGRVKPKDMKKAAIQRVQESYIHEQEGAARMGALDAFRVKRPPYPTDPTRLVSSLHLQP